MGGTLISETFTKDVILVKNECHCLAPLSHDSWPMGMFLFLMAQGCATLTAYYKHGHCHWGCLGSGGARHPLWHSQVLYDFNIGPMVPALPGHTLCWLPHMPYSHRPSLVQRSFFCIDAPDYKASNINKHHFSDYTINKFSIR